eukprot:sb/3478079/
MNICHNCKLHRTGVQWYDSTRGLTLKDRPDPRRQVSMLMRGKEGRFKFQNRNFPCVRLRKQRILNVSKQINFEMNIYRVGQNNSSKKPQKQDNNTKISKLSTS